MMCSGMGTGGRKAVGQDTSDLKASLGELEIGDTTGRETRKQTDRGQKSGVSGRSGRAERTGVQGDKALRTSHLSADE